jgi:hypothetical protein
MNQSRDDSNHFDIEYFDKGFDIWSKKFFMLITWQNVDQKSNESMRNVENVAIWSVLVRAEYGKNRLLFLILWKS